MKKTTNIQEAEKATDNKMIVKTVVGGHNVYVNALHLKDNKWIMKFSDPLRNDAQYTEIDTNYQFTIWTRAEYNALCAKQ